MRIKTKFIVGCFFSLFLMLAGCNGGTMENESAQASGMTVEEVAQEEENVEVIKLTQAVQSSESKRTKQSAEDLYDYNDFIGYYMHFNSADRSHSDMLVTVRPDYLTIGWWMSEYELYEILDRSLEGNALTIDYYLQPYSAEDEGEYGSMTLYLVEENDEIYLDFGSNMPFYKTTFEEVQEYQYTIQEDLYEETQP